MMTSFNNGHNGNEIPPGRVLSTSIFGAETCFSLTVALPGAQYFLIEPTPL